MITFEEYQFKIKHNDIKTKSFKYVIYEELDGEDGYLNNEGEMRSDLENAYFFDNVEDLISLLEEIVDYLENFDYAKFDIARGKFVLKDLNTLELKVYRIDTPEEPEAKYSIPAEVLLKKGANVEREIDKLNNM